MFSNFLCPLLIAIRSGHVTTSDKQCGVALEGVKLTRNLVAGVKYISCEFGREILEG